MNYAVSDIHGCFNTFMKLLEKVKFDENKDKLYILGDIVDRGPRIWETYEWVRNRYNKSVEMICGNHENELLMNIFALKGKQRYKDTQEGKEVVENSKMIAKFLEVMKEQGGDRDIFEQMRGMAVHDQYGTIRKLRENHSLDELVEMAIFFFGLPYYKEVNGFTLVHASCNEDLENTDPDTFYWDRALALYEDYFIQGKKVVFGHTPTTYYTNAAKAVDITSEDRSDTRKINIDCGCAYGGRLCLFRLNDEKFFYQQNIE